MTHYPAFYNPLSFILLVIFIFEPIVYSIPFISKRKILLTSKELHLQLAISEDVIKTKDITSIEYLGRKRPQLRFELKGKNSTGLEALFNWGGYNLPPFLGVRYSKEQEKETKWYFFSGKRYYFKINTQNGTAICFSVNNPQLFANKLNKIMPSIASDLVNEIEQYKELIYPHCHYNLSNLPEKPRSRCPWCHKPIQILDRTEESLNEKEEIITTL